MPQMYKVFINRQLLHFVSDIHPLPAGSPDIVINEPLSDDLLNYIEASEHGKMDGPIWFTGKNPDAIFACFCKFYKIVEAAGGLIRNDAGEVLFIFRMGRWDLPKGKSEQGETAEQTAIREVEEETGVRNITIIKELQSTYHTYHLNGKRILKKTRWFEMHCPQQQNFIPQTGEDISMVRWITRNHLEQVLRNTYASIRDLFNTL